MLRMLNLIPLNLILFLVICLIYMFFIVHLQYMHLKRICLLFFMKYPVIIHLD